MEGTTRKIIMMYCFAWKYPGVSGFYGDTISRTSLSFRSHVVNFSECILFHFSVIFPTVSKSFLGFDLTTSYTIFNSSCT